MIKTHDFEVLKTARYSTLGEEENFETVWFVLHGYGQLSPYFIKKFQALDDGKTLVVAPEGLHRYYLNNSSGRVGASWMTKEARLDDISDYISFLDQLYQSLLNPRQRRSLKVNVLGFSQGVATASRWVANQVVRLDNFIMWAGVFPPDMNFKQDIPYFNQLNTQIVLGDNDEFVNGEKLEEYKSELEEWKLKYDFTTFKGKHDIDEETLLNISKKLE